MNIQRTLAHKYRLMLAADLRHFFQTANELPRRQTLRQDVVRLVERARKFAFRSLQRNVSGCYFNNAPLVLEVVLDTKTPGRES